MATGSRPSNSQVVGPGLVFLTSHPSPLPVAKPHRVLPTQGQRDRAGRSVGSFASLLVWLDWGKGGRMQGAGGDAEPALRLLKCEVEKAVQIHSHAPNIHCLDSSQRFPLCLSEQGEKQGELAHEPSLSCWSFLLVLGSGVKLGGHSSSLFSTPSGLGLAWKVTWKLCHHCVSLKRKLLALETWVAPAPRGQ